MNTKSRCLSISALLFFPLSLMTGVRQEPTDKTVAKKTESGFEISVLEASAVKDRDPLNNVPLYRWGSCPPAAVLSGIKMEADNGKDVIIVRLAIKVLSTHGGQSLSVPILLDAEGKKFLSKNTMLADSLPDLLRRLKGKDEQLQCEFPFEVPKGTLIKQLKAEDVLFDLKIDGRL